MFRCGDCPNFLPQSINSAANVGLCKAILNEEGLGKETDLYADASGCAEFHEQERIRTNVSEFMWNLHLRMAKGFDEK
ncbi:MAG: hypothetical protein SWO11_08830 [Thermodesulfobacteriota bacterium]|nr:hypothetical protein [Thermodesulfobacteriota bacterium]